MPETAEIPVRLSLANDPKQSIGTVRVTTWSPTERTRRALKWGGVCFGAAAFCVLLPLVHWVLVPSLLIATPFVARYFLNLKSAISGGEGQCPNCKKTFPIARGPDRFPFEDLCNHCRKRVNAEKT